jgi:hypothetical protein
MGDLVKSIGRSSSHPPSTLYTPKALQPLAEKPRPRAPQVIMIKKLQKELWVTATHLHANVCIVVQVNAGKRGVKADNNQRHFDEMDDCVRITSASDLKPKTALHGMAAHAPRSREFPQGYT